MWEIHRCLCSRDWAVPFLLVCRGVLIALPPFYIPKILWTNHLLCLVLLPCRRVSLLHEIHWTRVSRGLLLGILPVHGNNKRGVLQMQLHSLRWTFHPLGSVGRKLWMQPPLAMGPGPRNHVWWEREMLIRRWRWLVYSPARRNEYAKLELPRAWNPSVSS